MCGIVGYIGDSPAKGLVIDGLKRLEYRGYDSAGIAICIDGQIQIRKEKGREYRRRDLRCSARISLVFPDGRRTYGGPFLQG